MKDDTVSRAAVMESLTKEYNRRRTGDGLKLAWIEKAVNEVPAVQTCEDAVSRADVLETYADLYDVFGDSKAICKELHKVYDRINALPAVQPEPLSDAYTKAVWTWLLDYQTKAAELKGRYTPYEVLSWVANDWRKEHERSD